LAILPATTTSIIFAALAILYLLAFFGCRIWPTPVINLIVSGCYQLTALSRARGMPEATEHGFAIKLKGKLSQINIRLEKCNENN
jgi:hypothetical protein